MKKLNNKGFTIVELVIVVAVIAILAAVLIPTVSGLVKTAQTSADVTLVKNVNLVLATERATEGKNATMQDALDDALEGGYDIAKLTPTNSDNYILWDQESDNFVLFANGKYNNVGADVDVNNIVPSKLWEISKTTDDATHSIYYIGDETEVDVNGVGFDVGTSSVATVNYVNTTGTPKNVVIRTNGGSLTINAAADTVKHYGYAEVLDVQAIASASYHEYGTSGFARLVKGHFVVESEGIVNVLYATGTKTGDTKVIVDNNGGIIGKAYAIDDSVANEENGAPKQEGNIVLVKDDSVTSDVITAVTANNIAETVATNDTLKEIVANSTFRGEGSEQSPYLISNVQELVTFRNLINGDSTNAQYRDKFYKLEKNIDLGNEEWTPIGIIKDGTNTYTTYKPFTGYFDGNHKSISGIKITNSASGEGTGFFGDISENATIVDLTITVDINIPEGTVVAGLVGCYDVYANSQYYNDNTLSYNSVISGITVNGNIVAKKKVAGVIAYNYGADEGKNLEVVQSYLSCINNANVTGTRVGGIASVISGQFRKDQTHNTYHRVIVKGCINNGVITNNGSEYGGGIIAQICAPGNYEFEDLTNNTSLVGNSTYGIIGKSLIPQSTVGDIDANAHLDFELNNYLSQPIPGYDVYGGNNLDNICLSIGGGLYAYSRVRQDDLFMSDSEWRITIGEKHYMTAEGSGINSLNDLTEQVSHRSNNPDAIDFANILTQNGYSYTGIDGNTINGITKNN